MNKGILGLIFLSVLPLVGCGSSPAEQQQQQQQQQHRSIQGLSYPEIVKEAELGNPRAVQAMCYFANDNLAPGHMRRDGKRLCKN